MNKKSIYVKPMICVVALETNPILAALSIAADSEFETEEANSKGGSFDDSWDCDFDDDGM